MIDIVTDYVSRVHLSLLERDVADYDTMVRISREILSKFPEEHHDMAADNLYRVLLELGMLAESDSGDDDPKTVELKTVELPMSPTEDPVLPSAQPSAMPSPVLSATTASPVPAIAEEITEEMKIRPSTLHKQRDAYLADSLDISVARLKYNRSTHERLSKLQPSVLEFWQFLDESYSAATYACTRFGKEKIGKYAVFVDGRLQQVYDTHERASDFKHARAFPFNTYIVCIGDKWEVRDPCRRTYNRFQNVYAQLTKVVNGIGHWLLDHPLTITSILMAILAYYIITNQPPSADEFVGAVHYRMGIVDIDSMPTPTPTPTPMRTPPMMCVKAMPPKICCGGGKK